MANGFHGSDDEWQRLESPLRRLDEVLEQFAERHGLALAKNEKNWPDRTFRWGTHPSKLIQVFLEDSAVPSYTVWASAYDDRSREEYWKHKTLLKAAPIEAIVRQLPQLLSEAMSLAKNWEMSYDAD